MIGVMTRFLIAVFTLTLAAADAYAESSSPLLFESHEVMNLTMPVNFDNLCRPRETPDCDYVPTVFEYRNGNGQMQTVPISIRRRDGWRATETNCQVPTIFVRFDPKQAAGTPFEGQTTLALTSHCGKGISTDNKRSRTLPDEFESYVGNEFFGYRLYNLVTDVSLKVRFVRITYANPENPRRSFTRNGFFAEHFESLAKRFNAELVSGSGLDLEKLDRGAADQIALFNYMIGNTDWSILVQDNIFLLRFPDGRQVPVLFDLDMSGLVNAHYAVPAPDLPINSVKQRHFQGFCNPESDWDALFAKFSALENDMLRMLIDTPGMGRGDRRASGAYLLDFFDILDSSEERQRKVIDACRELPGA
jgi:hypothetical protein